MPFLKELSDHLAAMRGHFRDRRDYGAVLKTEVAQDIIADATGEQGRVGRLAYTAEQSDLEAKRLAELAQMQDSPGGQNITPDEMAPIFRCITRSAEGDHQITEALA